MIKQIKRYMNWYENRTQKRFGVLKKENGGINNVGNFLSSELKQRVSIFYWFFNYQNIFTYILKITLIIGLYMLLLNTTNSYFNELYSLDASERISINKFKNIVAFMFLPLISFFMIGCAKGIRKGFIYSFPLCIITVPLMLIRNIFKK